MIKYTQGYLLILIEYKMLEYKWIKYNVMVAETQDNPRTERDQQAKLCIRNHNHYNFVNELDFDFDLRYDYTWGANAFNSDDWEEYDIEKYNEMRKQLEKYFIYPIDCHEHWDIIFKLSWEWTQCQFDTSKNCGFIAISKELTQMLDNEEDIKKILRHELEEYTNYINGRVYEWYVDYYNIDQWDNELFWPYYTDNAYNDIEEECKNNIDNFLRTRKQYKIKVQIKQEIEYDIYAETAQKAYDISQQKELPSGYIEWTHDTQSIECEWQDVFNEIDFAWGKKPQ